MSILSCLDGIVCLSGFNTFCSACNVLRSCVQCSCFSVDCIHKICDKEYKPKALKLEYIEGDKYIDLATGNTLTIQIFAKPKILDMPI